MARDHGATRAEAPFERVSSLLGGLSVLNRQPTSRLDIHELLLGGLPSKALINLVAVVDILREPEATEKAIGISFRTIQRHKQAHSKTLNLEQSGRIWEFAELLTRATSVLGSSKEAEAWFLQPAVALEQRRPLDLLATSEGRRMVEELLERMEFGVYT